MREQLKKPEINGGLRLRQLSNAGIVGLLTLRKT